jgi:lipopolysaccharide export system protein LptC
MNWDINKSIIAAVLLALVALSIWLPNAFIDPVLTIDNGPQGTPDYIIENFTSTAMDQHGRPKHVLSAARLVHYPNEKSAYLEQPRLVQYAPGSPPVHTTADRGKVYNDGKELQMTGNVRVTRGGDGDDPSADVIARELHVILN